MGEGGKKGGRCRENVVQERHEEGTEPRSETEKDGQRERENTSDR